MHNPIGFRGERSKFLLKNHAQEIRRAQQLLLHAVRLRHPGRMGGNLRRVQGWFEVSRVWRVLLRGAGAVRARVRRRCARWRFVRRVRVHLC